ncbi:MFS family transporter [Roseomonas elaeocarpi]|uniref:MFS family transporter n=1 Tax=Roseomonas elaeocarpi TaxID=907779 RepID=A0ABV6JYK1_9PROT
MDHGAIREGEVHETRHRITAIMAAASGNLVEWYDFYAYSFTALYFARAFFPNEDPTVQLLNAAAVFAIGFLMRPIGGWLFGWLADRKGRRFSMLISVLLMCGGSLLIAVLPTYATAGIVAPALLLLARMAQGLAVGGEYGASATYMSEVAGDRHRGFFASFHYVTLIGGQLLAVLVIFLIEQVLTADEIRAWGWRIPFVIGAVAAVVAMVLRRTLHETTTEASRSRKEAGSIRALLRHPLPLLVVLGLTVGGSLAFYTFTTYMQKYLVNTAGMPVPVATRLMVVALFVFMVLQPVFGALSDAIGRKVMLIAFGVLGVVCTVPLLNALGQPMGFWPTLGLVLGCLVIVSCYTSVSGLVKAELFPIEVRALGVGLPYAIANAAFGGTAESVALSLKSSGIEWAFAWYVVAMVAVALVAAVAMPDTRTRGHMPGRVAPDRVAAGGTPVR